MSPESWWNLSGCSGTAARGLLSKPVTCYETRSHAQQPKTQPAPQKDKSPVKTTHFNPVLVRKSEQTGSLVCWEVYGNLLILIHINVSLRFSESFRGCRCVEPCEGVRSWFGSDSAAVWFSHVYRFMLPQTLLHTQIHTAHTARLVKSMTSCDSKIHLHGRIGLQNTHSVCVKWG